MNEVHFFIFLTYIYTLFHSEIFEGYLNDNFQEVFGLFRDEL